MFNLCLTVYLSDCIFVPGLFLLVIFMKKPHAHIDLAIRGVLVYPSEKGAQRLHDQLSLHQRDSGKTRKDTTYVQQAVTRELPSFVL